MEILDDRGAVQCLNRRQNETIITKMFILYCSTDVLIVVTNDDIVICKEKHFSRIVWGISRVYRMHPVFFPCRGIGVSAAEHSILLSQSHSLRYVWCVWYQPVIAYRHCFSLPFVLSIHLSISLHFRLCVFFHLIHSMSVCLSLSRTSPSLWIWISLTFCVSLCERSDSQSRRTSVRAVQSTRKSIRKRWYRYKGRAHTACCQEQ